MNLLLSPLDNRITLKGALGAGGMGEVHRAWDAGLERPVAVKFLRGSDPKEADRLLLEARLQARVEHPHVVRVHDTGTLGGRPCILMQLVEGRTYADLGEGTDWRLKVSLGAQAARGLGAAHRMGLVHRDVKPGNILVEDSEEGPQARLSDFGLARDEEGGLTRSGLLMGTVDYMSPEQVSGGAPVDYRADIYGLGATLYAVLAGHPPFRPSQRKTGAAESTRDLRGATPEDDIHPGDLLRRVMEQEPPSLSAEAPGLPRDLATVVAKAMEKEPIRRYATAEAFADDLERVLKGEPIQARRTGWMERGVRWARRNPVASRSISLAVAAVLLGVVVIAWTQLRSRKNSQIAAEISAEATRMGEVLRTARLMPFHPLVNERKRVQQAMHAVRLRMASQGRPAFGPGNFALGLAEHAAGRLEEAEKNLRSAWDSGFRSEGLRIEFAHVLLRRYQAELKRIEQLYAGSRRDKLLLDLDLRFKTPVRTLMTGISPGGGQAGLVKARMAFADRKHDEALSLADAALLEDSTRYEAIHLKGNIYYDLGDLEMKAGRPKEALPRFERAGELYAEAMAYGRSDPELWRDEGTRLMTIGQAHTWLGSSHEVAFRESEKAFRKSLVLDDQNAGTWRILGRLHLLRANQRHSAGASSEKEMAQAMASLEHAEAIDPDRASTQALLAGANEMKGVILRQAGQDGLPFMLEAVRRIRLAVKLEPENESHREGLANTLGTTLDFLIHKPEEGRPLAREMVQAARWMAEAFPERPNSKVALIVALVNTITFEETNPEARVPVYAEARELFEKADAQAGENLMLMSDLALAAGTAAETALGKNDPVEPWAAWALAHARRLLEGRPGDPMGLYSMVRVWRVKAEAMDLSESEWALAIKEAGSAANLAVSRKLLPREVTFEYARLISLASLKQPAMVHPKKALHWVRLGRRDFGGDPVLTAREKALLIR